MAINRAVLQMVWFTLLTFVAGVAIGIVIQNERHRGIVAAAEESVRVCGWQRENYRARLLECRGIHTDEEPVIRWEP